MRGFKFALLSLVALGLSAAPISISTGTNMNWQVSYNSGTATTAVVLGNELPLISTHPSFAGFGWVGNQGEWIGQAVTDGNYNGGACAGVGAACAGALPGTYTYTLTWTSILGGTLNISEFTGDNGVKGIGQLTVTVNGGPSILTAQSASQSAFATGGTVNYGAGTVVITAVVINDEVGGTAPTGTRNPSGFILKGTADETTTPEPSTYAMLGLGGLAMFIARRRK